MKVFKYISVVIFLFGGLASLAFSQSYKHKDIPDYIYPEIKNHGTKLPNFHGCVEGDCKKGKGVFIAFIRGAEEIKKVSGKDKKLYPYTATIFSGSFSEKGKFFTGKVYEVNGKTSWLSVGIGSGYRVSEGGKILDPKRLTDSELLMEGHFVEHLGRNKGKQKSKNDERLTYKPLNNVKIFSQSKSDSEIVLSAFADDWMISEFTFPENSRLKHFKGISNLAGSSASFPNFFLFSSQRPKPVFGTLTYKNGDKYIGPLHNHMPHGLGVKTTVNGSIEKGLWFLGTFMQELDVPLSANIPAFENNTVSPSSYDLDFPFENIKYFSGHVPKDGVHLVLMSKSSLSIHDRYYNTKWLYWGTFKDGKPNGWGNTIFFYGNSLIQKKLYDFSSAILAGNGNWTALGNFPVIGAFKDMAFSSSLNPYLYGKEFLNSPYLKYQLKGCSDIYAGENYTHYVGQMPEGWRVNDAGDVDYYHKKTYEAGSVTQSYAQRSYVPNPDSYNLYIHYKPAMEKVIAKIENDTSAICDARISAFKKSQYIDSLQGLITYKMKQEDKMIKDFLNRKTKQREQRQGLETEFLSFLNGCSEATFVTSQGTPHLSCGGKRKNLEPFAGDAIQQGMVVYFGGRLQYVSLNMQKQFKNNSRSTVLACYLDNKHLDKLSHTCPVCNGSKISTSQQANTTRYSPQITYENGFVKKRTTSITSYQTRYNGVCGQCAGEGVVGSAWAYGQ